MDSGHDIAGPRYNECVDGDYLQVVIGPKVSEKLCGTIAEGMEYVIGPYGEDVTVKGIFHSNDSEEAFGAIISQELLKTPQEIQKKVTERNIWRLEDSIRFSQ